MSKKLPIKIGVPQGSVLGPILFLIYINDLPLIFDNCKCHLYADDTTLYCCAHTKLEAERLLQENIEKVSVWLKNNRLVVNVSKSNIMLVGIKSSVGEYVLSASLNQVSLTPTNEIKLLGINIDCHLNWKNHIKLLCKSISPKVGLLHRLSRFLPKKQLSFTHV